MHVSSPTQFESARMVVRGPIEEGLTLQYVTKNIIALTSPDEGTERAYVESLKTATINLKNKHSGHYKVWSVSRSRNDVARCLDADQCGWPPGIAPPLDRLCAICKGIEKWLAADCENVVVIHCKGDRGRVAMVISAYMHYNAICSGDDCVEERFCMQRFSERYIGANGQPSQKRYINYFASLLSGKIRVNPAPMYLHRITLTHTVGRILAFKVYERLDPVYQSCEIASKDSVKLDIEGEVRLRGDIIIKCFIINNDQRKLLFVCQLNTCALEEIVKPLILTFHKEELDLVFADPNFDNRSVFELHVSSEPVRNGTIKRKSLQENRTNSYGDFDEPEDSSVPVVEYSEIRKKPFSLPLAKEVKEQDDEEPLRDADIGKDRDAEEERDTFVEKEDRNLGSPTKNNKMPPPPVPPKPRSASAMDEPEYQHQEPRGVLPAHVRPLTHRPPSPKEGQLGRNTPSAAPNIEPDTNLIGKDRYDKASKCFSYVPAKVLKETFENPRPPRRLSLTRTIERREDYVDDVRPDEIRRVQLLPADIPRRDETPKWEDEIEAAKQQALLDELARIPTRSQSVAAQPYYMRNDYSDDRAEKPLVFDQAQRATATPTSTLQRTGSGRLKTRYGSYRQLNDEQYSSDMDDLCDPDYYLNYTNGSKTAPRPPPRQQHMGAKSVEFPRKHYQPVEKFTDPLDDILASTMSSERTSGGYHAGRPHLNGPMPPASSYSDLRDPRDQYRNRNCRSVAAVSGNHERTHTIPGEHRNDVVDAADDWLNQKLKKAKSNRNVDPDLARRRTQEKVLLEELKAKDEKVNEYADPRSTAIDPLAEFKREEERLKNTHSPFDDSPRRARQIRGKPPTPPPRERSRSPARSDRLTPSVDNYRSLNGGATSDDFDFSTLNSIVQPSYAASDRPDSRGAYSHHGHSHLRRGQSFGAGDSRPPFQYNDSSYRAQTPTHFVSGQERVAAAIYRAETPAREMYSSGTLNRSETPCGRYFPENSVVLQRSETPAFPVSRETPLPFHPLLYSQNSNSGPSNGGGTHSNGTHGSGTGTPVGSYGNGNDRASTLNNRAASPRSQYGQFSRRSSLTSVECYDFRVDFCQLADTQKCPVHISPTKKQ
ncbi:hypothetical protein WR25_05925 [Diploscapter pachys]|uniref:Phosphatidylinositol-3,4,5-trisphosphate 3-phosphatase n=1 Tax=Diploscapter pachys TaxID=2018661 RepID=A0A2A2J264_9BILA|nr:hypothetical protein WR25_05925 [Diploscapter pachys]